MNLNIDLHLGSPLGMAGGGAPTATNCWNPPGINGDWVGYRFADTAYGSLETDYTASGTFFYAFELNKTTGEARIILSDDDGATPGYQEPNTVDIIVEATQFGNLELAWNDAEKYYQDYNLELANAMHDHAVANPTEDVCFRAVGIPELMVHYTFEKLENSDG